MLLHSRPLVSGKVPIPTSLIMTQSLHNLHRAIQNQKLWLKLPTPPVQHVESDRGISNAPREAFSPTESWQSPACDKLVLTLLDHTSFEASGCEGNDTCRSHTAFRGVIAVLPGHKWFAERSSEHHCVPPPGCKKTPKIY